MIINNKPVWKMRNGRLISVDDMDINHLRNVLKMIIRNNYRVQVVQAKPKVEFKLNGKPSPSSAFSLSLSFFGVNGFALPM